MSYFSIADFKSGLDLRRKPYSAPAGTLQQLINAHVTAGGEIEKRLAFVQYVGGDLTGTIGMAGIGTNIYVFETAGGGLAATAAAAPPVPSLAAATPVLLFKITLPGAYTFIRQMDWDIFNGRGYVVMQDSLGGIRHFYQDDIDSLTWTEVTTWPAAITDPTLRPQHIRTFQGKMYGVQGPNLWFSAVGDPTDWDTGTGAGFINLASQDAESADNLGLEVYFGKLAIMSNYSTQIWQVDPDPNNSFQEQVLRNAGTFASRSVRQYGNGDVLFLSASGIRSLNAKDSSNSAAVTDIGSPVEPEIRDILLSTPSEQYSESFALTEPITGRFWMVVAGRVFVLSYFPGPKVTAWSEYVPEFQITDGVVIGPVVAVRSATQLYLYGGETNNVYDDAEVTVETPFLDVEHPAHRKQFFALDAALECDNGAWQIDVSFDPTAPNAADTSANVSEVTYQEGTIPLSGVSSHVAVRLTHKAQGYALLGNLVIHYNTGEAD